MTYNDYETKGRMKLKQLLQKSKKIKNYEFCQYVYERFDCMTTGVTGNIAIFEIKDRKISSDKYDTILFEKGKYDAMMDSYRNSGYTPYYVIFYTDCYYVFPVSKIKDVENRVQEILATHDTVNYSYDDKVTKKVIMLDKEEGIKCNYE